MSGEDRTGAPEGAWHTITLIVMAVLGMGIVAGLILTLGEANRQRDRALRAQAHSYDVMILARTLSGTIARSEASLGRYVISGDKQLGRLYFEQWQLAGQQIDRLDRITEDNAVQQPRIDRLRSAYEARGAELSLTALSTNYGKNAQALARYYQARKAASLATIDATLDDIIARERDLLDVRTGEAMRSVAQTNRMAGILSAFGLLIVLGAIVLGWLTVRVLGERGAARVEAERERDRAEELTRAVADATAELRVQEARLRQVQKMEAVGQLTGGIAHDFNNMLAVVLGGLELARRSLANGSADAPRHIASATEGATRAATLTRQLLAFAREDAINPEPLVAGDLIGGMRDLLDRTLGDGIAVLVDDRSDGWRVLADRVQLENTVLNLAVNARDAMDGRGTLTIRATAQHFADVAPAECAPGDYLTIAVRDTGAGMTREVLERACDPFFTTKPVGKGTGLGLSQAFGLARRLGGGVAIDSAPGQGTTVTLYLPRAQAAPAAVSAHETPAALASGRSRDILVVEDDPRVLAATLGALEELGHRVTACADPLRVPAMLDADAGIDLIVSDVLMPGQTGPEMVEALPARHAQIAVLFVTGFAGEGGDFGGRPVLRKPFTLAALERAVAQAAGADIAHRIAAE